MSESNGVLRIGRQGRKKFQFGDDDPAFEIDVIDVYNQFSETDLKLRDAKGVLTPDKVGDWNKAVWGFVQQVVLDHMPKDAAEKVNAGMSLTDARAFLKLLQEEANRLIPLFKLESGEKPSSPENSGIAVSYE